MFYLDWIWQVLPVIRFIQPLWISALSLFFREKEKNLTTSSSKTLPQPKHFRKSCEGFTPIWNPAEIAPSACSDLQLASGTRHYAAAPIFIIYTTTNRALGMRGFFFFLVLAEVTTAAALVITLLTVSHESHSSWSPLPKNCPHFHLHYLNCQTWKLSHPLQQISYNTLFLQ